MGLIHRKLDIKFWREIFSESITTTGSIFALIIGATSFTLGLRLLGTDRLVSSYLINLPYPDSIVISLIMFGLLCCASFIDVIEVIFVIVPIIAPPLFMRSHDPQWIAVLIIFVIQLGYLCPPFGYSIALLRSLVKPQTIEGSGFKNIIPYLACILFMIGMISLFPNMAHLLDKKSDALLPKLPNSSSDVIVVPLPDSPSLSPNLQ